MLAARLLTNPLRQNLGSTTCKALVHTEPQIPDRTAGREPIREISEDPPPLATRYFDQFPNYCQMINDAKSRARRSVLIDHCGIRHIDLKTEFTNIERVYSIERETRRGLTKLSLIEFETENDAESVAKRAKHNEGLLPVPLKIFRYIGEACTDQQDLPFPVENIGLSYKRKLIPNRYSYTDLVASNSMSLVALKMRFITLVNFERILCSGMFEEYELMPYGSSIIDMGCDSGDLDLVITRKENHHQLILDSLTRTKKLYRPETLSKLAHLDKSLYSESKDSSGLRGTMRWFDHILREYMPLTDGHGVLFVSHAKVPIIKFNARITAIDCDLSFNLGLDYRERDILTTNYSGIVMSQVLYSLCRNNNLFRAVVICLRIYGGLTSITSKQPGIGFTNFQLLSLILFYLQQTSIESLERSSKDLDNSSRYNIVETNNSTKQRPIIPPFKNLLNADFNVKESAISLDNHQLNQIVPKVLAGFFEYYSNFDFNGSSLNLYESKVDRKLDNSSIYVLNPMDTSRNICHNVNRKALDNFVRQVRTVTSCLRAPKDVNLLSIMHDHLDKQNELARKSRSKPVELFTRESLSNRQKPNLTTEGIARDVCR